MWAILEQMRDHATTIVGLVTALMLMYSWFRKPMKQLIAREQQQEEDLAILTWAFLQNAHDSYTRQGWCCISSLPGLSAANAMNTQGAACGFISQS